MLYFGTKVNSFNFREGNKASNSISKKKKNTYITCKLTGRGQLIDFCIANPQILNEVNHTQILSIGSMSYQLLPSAMKVFGISRDITTFGNFFVLTSFPYTRYFFHM